MSASKENIIQELYEICRDRSLTSKEVASQLVNKLLVVANQETIDKIAEIVRPYKNSAMNLSGTADKVYEILHPYRAPMDHHRVGFSTDFSGGYAVLSGPGKSFSIVTQEVQDEIRKTFSNHIMMSINDCSTRKLFTDEISRKLYNDYQATGYIGDYKVVCDDTNNPPHVVNSNCFAAQIFLKENFTGIWTEIKFESGPGMAFQFNVNP